MHSPKAKCGSAPGGVKIFPRSPLQFFPPLLVQRTKFSPLRLPQPLAQQSAPLKRRKICIFLQRKQVRKHPSRTLDTSVMSACRALNHDPAFSEKSAPPFSYSPTLWCRRADRQSHCTTLFAIGSTVASSCPYQDNGMISQHLVVGHNDTSSETCGFQSKDVGLSRMEKSTLRRVQVLHDVLRTNRWALSATNQHRSRWARPLPVGRKIFPCGLIRTHSNSLTMYFSNLPGLLRPVIC